MDLITFKNYKFYYDANMSDCLMDNENLTFLDNKDQVRVHVSFQDNILVIRPRIGVTIQKLANKSYQIITN